MAGVTDLAQAMSDLDEAQAVALVEARLAAGTEPLAVLQELQLGMNLVGQRFESGEYYLSELIYGADIFQKASAPLQERLQGAVQEKLGTLVLGTVKDDIHDFGKNIVATLMRANGIEIVDLGVDVDAAAFVQAIRDHKPQLVGMSCLLTTAFDSMKDTIQAIEMAGLRNDVTILIGGGPVDENTREYVGADRYCRTAQDGVTAAKEILGVN
ncbi:MAG: cobalamin-dependent protein [Thermoleophilia bacterium]|nr:cobalamin-dependent protein [Thermoleophilia bacterium]